MLRNQPAADTARAKTLLDLGAVYHQYQLDSARLLYDQALALSRRLDWVLGEISALSHLQTVTTDEAKFAESIAYGLEGIRVSQQAGLPRKLGAFYHSLGNTQYAQGLFSDAQTNYLKAIANFEQFGNEARRVGSLANFTALYVQTEQYQKALVSGKDGLKRTQGLHRPDVEMALNNSLGNALYKLGRESESMPYYQETYRILREMGDQHSQATIRSNIASVLISQKRYPEALQMLSETLPQARSTQNHFAEMLILGGLGEVYLRQNQFDRAYEAARQVVRVARQNGIRDELYNTFLLLSDIELARGNFDQATVFRKQYLALKDSSVNASIIRNSQELETRYQTRQKKARIRALQQAQELQRLQRQRGVIWGLGILAFLVTLAGFLAYRNAQVRRRLAEQHAQLTEQQLNHLEQQRQLSAADAMLRGQEEERSRLARDLHDGLGGMLSGVRQTLNAMTGNQIMPDESARAFDRALDMLDTSIGELRRVARNLMPEALVRFGLTDALQDYCANLTDPRGLQIRFHAFGLDERLPQSVEIILFRVAQELLNNVQKHAAATEALVQLVRDANRLHLTVEDNGRGFDSAKLNTAPGVGWLSIRSRVQYLGGTLDLHSVPDQGTTVDVEIPLNPASS